MIFELGSGKGFDLIPEPPQKNLTHVYHFSSYHKSLGAGARQKRLFFIKDSSTSSQDRRAARISRGGSMG